MLFTVYVGTGAKNAMFTLRTCREANQPGELAGLENDHYVVNLANDYDRAEAKALDYYERMKSRIETEEVKVVFGGFDVEHLNRRRGKLSTLKTAWLEKIESGVWPFGKYANQKIEDAPDNYILFFADKIKDQDIVTQAIASVCMGIAMDRDLIKKREEQREERRNQDLLSTHFGEVGKRYEFSGEIVSVFFKESEYDAGYWINKVRCGNDLIVYYGNKLGERSDQIVFKGTVKRHQEYQEVKTTVINRPKIKE